MKSFKLYSFLLLSALFFLIPFSAEAVHSKAPKAEKKEIKKNPQKTKLKSEKQNWFKSLFSSSKDKSKDRSGKALANTGLITGVLSNVTFYLFLKTIATKLSLTLFFAAPLIGLVGITLSIIALIRNKKQKKSKSSKSFRKARRRAILGIICSSLTIFITTVLVIAIRSANFIIF